jgi:hypothetical protein
MMQSFINLVIAEKLHFWRNPFLQMVGTKKDLAFCSIYPQY